MKDLVDTTEMYLRTIYELEEEGVIPLRARIAERLEQSGPTVSQTVARMERDGLVHRTVYPTVPAQVDYRLTEMGASLTHLLKALADWSLEHRKDITQAQTDYDHTHPGRPVR